MKRDHQRVFEACCQKRLQQYIEPIDLDTTPQAIAQARYLAAYLDQWCLNIASKRLLSRDNLRCISRLPPTDLLREVPDRPVWIAIDRAGCEHDPFVACAPHHVIAAAFFYALECPIVLRHAFGPPVTQRSRRKSDPPTPAWWEWQLDLIAVGGDALSDYLFTYDARTAQWRKMVGSTCVWGQCRYTIDEQLADDPIVHICQNCQEMLHSFSSWLSTILNLNLGQKIFLTTPGFPIWKQRAFRSLRLV